MLTPTGVTTNAYNAAVKADAQSHIRMTFTDQNIIFTDVDFGSNGITITSILNGEIDLTMGVAVMTEVNAHMFVSDKTERLLWGKEFKLEIGLDVNGSTVWTTIGYFTGDKPEKNSSDDTIDFIAYDRMRKFDIVADAWLNSLDFTSGMTIAQIYASLCTYVGVSKVSGDELPNIMSRSYTVSPLNMTGYTCREILAYIAEACCCYAKIDNNGNCKMIWYSDHKDYELTGHDEFSVESSDLSFSSESKTWEDLEAYTWQELEQLTWADIENYLKQLQVKILSVKQTEDDIGVVVPAGSDPNSGLNTYMIIDNPLLATDSDAEVAAYITPIYTRLHSFGGYLPMNIQCVGNPLVETGDIITAEVKGEMVPMPLFSKTMEVNSSCTDQIDATGRITRERVSATNREKLSEGGRYHKFRNDINELYSELYDPTTGDVSVLKQTAQALGMSATGIDITGTKYVRIESGGTFDVDSANFKIDSTNRVFQTGDLEIKDALIYHLTYPTEEYPYQSYADFVIGKNITLTDYPNCVAGIVAGTFGTTIIYGVSSVTGFKQLLIGRIVVSSNSGLSDAHLQDAIIPEPLTWLGDGSRPFGYVYTAALKLCSTVNGGQEYGSIYGAATINGRKYNSSTPYISMYDETIVQAVSYMRVYSPYIEFKNTVNSTKDIWFDCDPGQIYAYGFNTTSSREKKHDIQPLESLSEQIDKLKPVSFVYNGDDEDQKQFGLIYEDTVDIIPEICRDDGRGNKTINYSGLIPVLLKEIQDLRKRVTELERR